MPGPRARGRGTALGALLLTLALAAAAPPAGAAPDSTTAPALAPTSAPLGPPAPDSAPTFTPRFAGRGMPARPPGRFEAPRWVMLRSLAVPGWGQLHNGSWIKATLIAAGEGTLAARLIEDDRQLGRLNARVDAARTAGDAQAELDAVAAYNDRQSALVGHEWLLGGLLLYAMVDAYVDAHFRHFDAEFRHDPALPDGPPAAPKLRLSYRWSF